MLSRTANRKFSHTHLTTTIVSTPEKVGYVFTVFYKLTEVCAAFGVTRLQSTGQQLLLKHNVYDDRELYRL